MYSFTSQVLVWLSLGCFLLSALVLTAKLSHFDELVGIHNPISINILTLIVIIFAAVYVNLSIAVVASEMRSILRQIDEGFQELLRRVPSR